MNKPLFRIVYNVITIALLTALLLWIHIWIQKITQPVLSQLELGLQYPSPDKYNFIFMTSVYLTAIVSVAVIVFLYYYCGHLLKIENKIIKSIVLAAIILEVKQDLIRQPLMNWLMHYQIGSPDALKIAFFRALDVWSSNLALAFLLVYFYKPKYSKNLVE